MDELKPQELLIVDDLEMLRTMADPLRIQIYELLLPAPANVRQVAERLGLAPSRLYYHINLMEKLGLLRVVETRMISNIVEKIYRAAAYKLDVAPGLLDFSNREQEQTFEGYLLHPIEATRDDLARSLEARRYNLERGAQEKSRHVVISRNTALIPDEVAEEFSARIKALTDAFMALDEAYPAGAADAADEVEERQQYALLVTYYPSFYYQDEANASTKQPE